MFTLRILWAGSIVVVLLLCGCARKEAPDKPLTLQDQRRLEQPHIKRITDSRLRASLVHRDSVLNGQELKRLRTMDRLAFFPKGPLRFCLIPFPTPASAIDPHRSLFVHDRATLDAATADPGKFTLRRTLTQIATQVSLVVPGTTAQDVFRQLWDTQNPAPGVIPTGAHCDDNGTTLNGFPNVCRAEGNEARGTDAQILTRMAEYRPLALVNRLDLAHEGWRNCGEHRIVYGKEAGGKNLIIFEAVLPNPKPGCREGCLPVAQFWKSLSTMSSPTDRALGLEKFFYDGIPGFDPVVHVNHYSATGVTSSYGSSGSGQIRTNQFLQSPWMMKEFKTVIDCGTTPCTFQIVPIMVKVNPFGPLWNEDVAIAPGAMQARAQDFEADVVLQVSGLASPNLLGMTYGVDLEHDAAQSFSQSHPGFVDNYREQANAAVATTFRSSLASGTLTSDQVVNRALTQSCAGCHMPSTFGLQSPNNSIGTANLPTGGTTTSWPNALGFVHVDTPTQPLPELAGALFGTGEGQRISPALLDVFLPARRSFLVDQLNKFRCPCRNRFPFLDDRFRNLAVRIDEGVTKKFEPRLEALQKELKAAGSDLSRLQEIQAASDRLFAERDQQVDAELKRAGITLPADEAKTLRPQVLRLEASKLAPGDPRRANALRRLEVMRLLAEEPPRRTVTGSFRVH